MLLVGYLGLVVYLNRAVFFSSFDAVYWKDKYEHSQWKLPLSERTLGDDGLYLYEGWRLIQGDDPTTLNAEVPPLAKYLIGASIKTFGNGYLYGLLTTSTALLLLFILTYLLTKNVPMSFAATLLVALDPLIARQFTLTMLDGLQLVFLLLAIIATILSVRTKRKWSSWAWAAAAGAGLGLFAEVKFPLFAPVVGIILLINLWRAKRRAELLVLFLLAAGIAYLLPYIPYFRMGHTFAQWLSVQKWIVMFFARSGLAPTFGSALTTLLFNRNQNLFSREYLPVPEWSPLWPFITIIGISGLIKARGDRHIQSLFFPVGIIALSILGFNLLIPFWTRYLVSILPFLYLGTIVLLGKLPGRMRVFFMSALLLVNMLAVSRIILPSPQTTVAQFISDWEHGFFQDMYEATDETTRRSISRTDFHRLGRTLWYDAEIEEAEITPVPFTYSLFTSPQMIPITVTYKTRNLGAFWVSRTLPIVREKGAWKIAWNWDTLLPGYTAGAYLETALEPARRGGLFAPDGIPLIQDRESVLIWLDPKRLDSSTEEILFLTLETLFDKNIKAVHFHERYVRLADLGRPIPMGVLMHPIDQKTASLLGGAPALFTTPAFGRFRTSQSRYEVGSIKNTLFSECCSLLYTTTTYDGADGLEHIYNTTLKGQNGGTLILKNANGEIIHTFLRRTKRDGENVRLTE